MVPFVDLKLQYDLIRSEIDAAIGETISTSAFISGPAVREFEQEFCKFNGANYAIGVGSGTDALRLSVKACDIRPGDEVITVPNTWISSAFAATHAGARVVLADINPKTFQMEPTALESALSAKSKAIIPVHMFGHPAPMTEIKAIAEANNLIIIEDVAQSPLAEIDGKLVGSFGDMACYSFYPSKNLGCYGDGGAITTNDANIAKHLRMLNNYGQVKRHDHQRIGYNSRLDTLQAAILSVKLKYLKKWTEQRRRLAKIYFEYLKGLPITLPDEAHNAKAVYHLFVIQVQRRDDCLKKLRDKGIMAQVHYPKPIHLQPCYKKLGYKKGDFPVAETLAENGLSLPFFPEMREDQIEEVVVALKSIVCRT